MTTTIEEVLAAWDAGEEITTCIMGGRSDEHEHNIHFIAMEMLRSMNGNRFDFEVLDSIEDEAEHNQMWADYRNTIYETPNVVKVLEEVQPHGAMCVAAGNLATVYTRNGYAGGLAMIPEDRIIKVSKTRCVLPDREVS